MLGLFHYRILYEILLDLNLIYDEDFIASHTLKKVSDMINAEGGTIFLLKANDILYPQASYGMPVDILRVQEFKIGKGIVGAVAAGRKTAKVDFPQKDKRFDAVTDRIVGFTTRNLLAAPIICGDKLVGVIEFVNKRSGLFGSADEELLMALGGVVGSAMEKSRMYKELLNKAGGASTQNETPIAAADETMPTIAPPQ